MRYKEQITTKLDAQSTKLKTLQKAIETNSMTAQDAIQFLATIIREVDNVNKLIHLESQD